MNPDIEKNIKDFARQYFLGFYITKENTIEQGRKIRYAMYMKTGRLMNAISQETYDANKEAIETIMNSAKAERLEREIRESWIVKALTGGIVTQVTKGEDYNLYALTAELPRDIWAQIKHLTQYIRSDEDMEGGCDFGGDNYKGWTIASGAESILKSIAEKTATPAQLEIVRAVLAEKEETKKVAEARKQEKQYKKQTLEEVLTAFKHAEYPEGNFNPEGERIEDPFYPLDIHGGGRFFIIGKKEIWFVKNNGHDGDDWGRNNIETGGAGGIGTKIKYNVEIAEKIRRLVI